MKDYYMGKQQREEVSELGATIASATFALLPEELRVQLVAKFAEIVAKQFL